jgi:hypothetical protein
MKISHSRTEMPKAEYDADEWQAAIQVLLLVAEHDRPAVPLAWRLARLVDGPAATALRWRAHALEPIDRQKKIGDAWGITGKACVDRTTAALRYYGLLDYQGGWQGARVRRFGGNSLVAILPHCLTTSGCHPRAQFHELHPQVLQGALVVGDPTLDVRQLEFK